METTLCNGALTTRASYPMLRVQLNGRRVFFSFYNRPMTDVLKDVERYYGIKIGAPRGYRHAEIYRSLYSREICTGEVLAIIGQPYGHQIRESFDDTVGRYLSYSHY
jgi:hypothetical protein